MCILSKLDYAKFDVSNLFFFKSYRRKPFGGRVGLTPPPPLGKGKVKITFDDMLLEFYDQLSGDKQFLLI